MKALLSAALLLLFMPSCIFVISTSEESERSHSRAESTTEPSAESGAAEIDGSVGEPGLELFDADPQSGAVRVVRGQG